MEIPFFKYEGTGNDFILVDRRALKWNPSQAEIARLCDRHFGIGADGLMLLDETPGYDFRMTYFNSDGNESTMCGNGGRCMTAFADRLGLGSTVKRFLAVDGEHMAEILEKRPGGMTVKLRMKDVEVSPRSGSDLLLDTGSPHLVRFVGEVAAMDVVTQGREIRYSEPFREKGVNIDFAEITNGYLFVRTYERGVENETLSCGTGVTASALAFALNHDSRTGRIRVETRGGTLFVSYIRNGNRFGDIWLEGPVREVFWGGVNSEYRILNIEV